MANKIVIIGSVAIAFALGDLYTAEVILGPDLKIPPIIGLVNAVIRAGDTTSARRPPRFRMDNKRIG